MTTKKKGWVVAVPVAGVSLVVNAEQQEKPRPAADYPDELNDTPQKGIVRLSKGG